MKKLIRRYYYALATLLISGLFVACGDSGKQEMQEETAQDFEWTSSSEAAVSDLERGLQLQEASNIQASRDALDMAIEKDPNFASAYVFRSYTSGSAKEFADDNKKALSLIENVSEPEKLMIQINQTYLNGEDDKRLALYKQLTTLLPESARAWTYYGQDLSGRNETAEARSMFEKAIGLDPNFVGAYVSAGGSYLNSKPKDFNQAKSMFEKAASIAPDMAYIHVNLGDALRALDDLEGSMASYNKALEMDNTLYNAYMKRGHVNSFLGNYEEARADYAAAREFNDTGGQGYDFEAFINLYAADDAKSTLAALEAAMTKIESADIPESRKQSGKTGFAFTGAWIAFHHNMPEAFAKFNAMREELDAKNAMDIGTEDAMNSVNARKALWNGYGSLLNDDYEAAMAGAEEFKSLKMNDPSPNAMNPYYQIMGIIQYEQEDYDAAIASFNSATGDNLYRKYYLAKAHMAAGNVDGAMPIMKEVAMDNFNSVFYALVRNEAKAATASM